MILIVSLLRLVGGSARHSCARRRPNSRATAKIPRQATGATQCPWSARRHQLVFSGRAPSHSQRH